MKKSHHLLSAAICCFFSVPALCGVEETYTYGTPPPTNSMELSWGIDTGAMNQHMIWEMQHAQSVQAGRSVYEQIQKKRKFCAEQPGIIELLKLECERNAMARDEARQKSCLDISLSIQGLGWTNQCRTDSINTKNTDIATCAVYAQSQRNSVAAICK